MENTNENLVEFKYLKEGEEKPTVRKVFVLNKNEAGDIGGIDFQYLNETQQSEVLQVLENHKVHDFPKKGEKKEPIEGFKPEWFKAFRRFNKSSMVEDSPEGDDKNERE